MDKPDEQEVMRVVELGETDWKWVCGWLDELMKSMGIGDLTPDLLRMAGIVDKIKLAHRSDEETEDGEEE